MFKTVDGLEKTEYNKLLLKFQTQAFDNYCNGFPNIQDYKDGILKKGFEVIKDCSINLSEFDFQSKIIIKNEGKSSLGNFFYEPVIFLGSSQITKENRLEPTFPTKKIKIAIY